MSSPKEEESPQIPASKKQKQPIFHKFRNIIHKGLEKSHAAIDSSAMIEECYGEDAAIFADSKAEGNKILVGLLEAALDKIDESVKEEVENVIRQEAESKLNHLDKAIELINKKEESAREAEEADRQSAQDAVRLSRIPDGISIDDIMAYQAYLIKKETRDVLLAQVDAAKGTYHDLSKKVEERRDVVNEKIKGLEDRNQSLGKAADLSSFHGVS